MSEFYLQDSRSYVGNDVLWWAKDGKGYTTDLRSANVYTKEEAQRQHESRPSDIPWPKDYIDQKTRSAVDAQYIKRDEALSGSGIVLVKPEKPKSERIKCHACGADNRPWATDQKEHDEPYQDIRVQASKRGICLVWMDDAPVRDYNAEQRANARLIAAAPELLEALIEYVNADSVEEELNPRKRMAHAAIAKAGGEA